MVLYNFILITLENILVIKCSKAAFYPKEVVVPLLATAFFFSIHFCQGCKIKPYRKELPQSRVQH